MAVGEVGVMVDAVVFFNVNARKSNMVFQALIFFVIFFYSLITLSFAQSFPINLYLKTSIEFSPFHTNLRFIELPDRFLFSYGEDNKLIISHYTKEGRQTGKINLAENGILGIPVPLGFYEDKQKRLFLLWISVVRNTSGEIYATEFNRSDLTVKHTTSLKRFNHCIHNTNMSIDRSAIAHIMLFEPLTGWGEKETVRFFKFDGQEFLEEKIPHLPKHFRRAFVDPVFSSLICFDSQNNPHLVFGKITCYPGIKGILDFFSDTGCPEKQNKSKCWVHHYYANYKSWIKKWRVEKHVIRVSQPNYGIATVEMCIDKSDGLHLIWDEFSRDNYGEFWLAPRPLYYQYRTPKGKWTKPEKIVDQQVPSSAIYQIACDDERNIYVIYEMNDTIFLKVKRGKNWLNAYQITNDVKAILGQVRIANDGNLLIRWDEIERTQENKKIKKEHYLTNMK